MLVWLTELLVDYRGIIFTNCPLHVCIFTYKADFRKKRNLTRTVCLFRAAILDSRLTMQKSVNSINLLALETKRDNISSGDNMTEIDF